MARKITPLADRVLIEPLMDAPTGQVFIPETSREKPTQGIVREVGPGKTLDNGVLVPLDVKVGDKVIFSRYSASEVKLDGRELRLVHENELLAILNDNAA